MFLRDVRVFLPQCVLLLEFLVLFVVNGEISGSINDIEWKKYMNTIELENIYTNTSLSRVMRFISIIVKY